MTDKSMSGWVGYIGLYKQAALNADKAGFDGVEGPFFLLLADLLFKIPTS